MVARGTHGGDFMGMPATGREIATAAICIHRVEDGRIVEQWLVSDGVGLLQQLGMMPVPAE
jgi:predicted ester cyclase